ncbi:phosphotriesterase-related protein [Rhodobacter sp. TJ_12]|uniref:phosphotriesterase family protein n=1 Tax=Rhodobacter sp. TJ_12 TaxID=2029399 RepID=UPI001CBDC592|nr:phosphotriesterase-related protein [Rhodobacter sp. TJ_12]MBZ4021934.1 phosphotriesterase-related protein [Rhodobacter sp. TJ_12]
MSERSVAHTGSGLVMTVNGPIPSADLGHTLMHEHLQNDCSCWWNPPKEPERAYLAEAKVSIEILGELRQDPFVNKHNIALDDPDLAIAELAPFTAAGGHSVVDPTCRGIGRDPRKLRHIAKGAGVNIVMGAGYYLDSSIPQAARGLSADAIADEIVAEALNGTDGTDAKIGLIGEIGVSSDFTKLEETSLRGAARAQARTGLPLMVHLPGWFRLGHKVLDIVEAEGGDLNHCVLCHMNPSHMDPIYQATLAQRGAYLEFDMVGMDFFYADQNVQCPSDDEVARAILALTDAGFGHKILLSHDVFVKMMLTRYGGNGYGFVTRHFLPRLLRHGLDPAMRDVLMVSNPRRVFDATF